MTFEELHECYKGILQERGDYDTDTERYTIDCILDGYLDLRDARNYLETFGDRETITYIAMGYPVSPDALRVAIAKITPNHPHKANCADRQICCKVCHDCGNELREVLDGELWCGKCGGYR